MDWTTSTFSSHASLASARKWLTKYIWQAVVTYGLAVAVASEVRAQPPGGGKAVAHQPTHLQGGFGVIGAAPVGDFAIYVPDGAGGFLGHLDSSLGESVFSLGGEFEWLLYGDESRKVSLAPLVPEVPRAQVQVNTTNAIVILHGRVRAQPRGGRWRPYIDGLFGFANIYTETSVEGVQDVCIQAICQKPSLGEQTQARDIVLSYGGGAGLMWGFTARPRAPRLDVSVRYLKGNTAEYLTQRAIRREGSELTLDFTRSRTDMLTVYIGLAFGR